MAERYYLVCTYALDVNCLLLRSRATDGLSRRLHLNLHESVHILCEKTSFVSGLIVHRYLIIVRCFVDCYDDVPDGHCFLQLDRDPRTREITYATRMTTDTAFRSLCVPLGSRTLHLINLRTSSRLDHRGLVQSDTGDDLRYSV